MAAADRTSRGAHIDAGAGVIGRQSELEAIHELLKGEASLGTLVLTGGPGIGKTTLWEAGVAAAREQGLGLLAARPSGAEARLSFTALIDLFEGVETHELAHVPAPQRAALEAALLRGSRAAAGTPEPRAIAVGFVNAVRALAGEGRLLIAIDDAQWLDPPSADVLAFAARRLAAGRVGFLLARRSGSPSAVEEAVEPGRRRQVEIGALDLGAVHALLELHLGYAYPRPTMHRIAELSSGNPLFALEIARALGPAPGLAPGAPLLLPESLRELVAGRVAAVSPRGRRALLVAAALSQPSAGLVERASSAAGLAAAEEAGLVRVDRGRVVFGHPLYAAAVYAHAASSRRRALHGRLAHLVGDAEERARHLALSSSGPDEEVANTLQEAAAHARARGAWETAGELLEQASALTPPSLPELALRRAVDAAEHHIHAGDRPRARALLEATLDDIQPSSLRCDALRLLSDIRYNEDSYAEAARLLEEARRQAEDPETSILIDLSLAFIYCSHLSERLDRADAFALRAHERAALVGDRALLANAIAVKAMVDFLRGRGIDWDKVDEALDLEDPAQVIAVQLRPSAIAGSLMLHVGRLSDARECLTALRLRLAGSGDESDLAFILSWLAWLETLSGQFEVAAELVGEASFHAALTGSDSFRVWALAMSALLRAHRGDLAARADAAAATEIALRVGLRPQRFWIGKAVALLELSLGNARAALAAVASFTEAIEEHGIGELLSAYYLPEALEAMIALAELDRAEHLLEMFARRGRELDRPWALATAWRCRGLLLAARGDLAGAADALRQALVEHERLDMPFELARTLLAQAQVRRRQRQRRAASESSEHALALFEAVGAALWADRARAELVRLTPQRRAGDLTTSERRVVELAAEGRSNKEIAQALFVTVHTVEAHLTHAYAKLGVRSRTQLARLEGSNASPPFTHT